MIFLFSSLRLFGSNLEEMLSRLIVFLMDGIQKLSNSLVKMIVFVANILGNLLNKLNSLLPLPPSFSLLNNNNSAAFYGCPSQANLSISFLKNFINIMKCLFETLLQSLLLLAVDLLSLVYRIIIFLESLLKELIIKLANIILSINTNINVTLFTYSNNFFSAQKIICIIEKVSEIITKTIVTTICFITDVIDIIIQVIDNFISNNNKINSINVNELPQCTFLNLFPIIKNKNCSDSNNNSTGQEMIQIIAKESFVIIYAIWFAIENEFLKILYLFIQAGYYFFQITIGQGWFVYPLMFIIIIYLIIYLITPFVAVSVLDRFFYFLTCGCCGLYKNKKRKKK